jgi:hypothetical protein
VIAMKINRREALKSTLFGAGLLGLRALATGLPASFLLNPRKALADDPAPSCNGPQYVILSTSTLGDPLNANVPGTYLSQFTDINHSADPAMAPAQMTIGGTGYTAATPWTTLPQNVIDRTCFFHAMTNTPVHPQEQQVLQMQGAITGNMMFPTVLAHALGPCLKTIQNQPVSVGAANPNEGLTDAGLPLPIILPTALSATLANAPGGVTNLQALRDQSLNSIYSVYKNSANTAQRNYIDSLVTSQAQARGIRQDLLAKVSQLTDDTPQSQILAAIALIQMGVAPVVSVHLPFGGDNHHDTALAQETSDTVASLGNLTTLMSSLASAGLSDSVTVLSLNVFGRTLSGNPDGRSHNPNHQVSIAIGKGFKGSVIGGITPVAGDYGALPIDSSTGLGSASGDITALATLAAFGQTALVGCGLDPTFAAAQIPTGKVVKAALSS